MCRIKYCLKYFEQINKKYVANQIIHSFRRGWVVKKIVHQGWLYSMEGKKKKVLKTTQRSGTVDKMTVLHDESLC